MAGTQSKSQELTERGKFWQKHLIAWNKTSLLQAEYCRQHNISQPAFGWWKRILHPKPRPLSTKQSSISKRTNLPRKKSFVEVDFANVNLLIGQTTYTYEIFLSHNRGIRLGADFDEAVLKQLIGILEQRC